MRRNYQNKPMEAVRSKDTPDEGTDTPVEDLQATIARTIHGVVDSTGKAGVTATEITATTLGHVGAMSGNIVRGVQDLFVKAYGAYKGPSSPK